jgi:transcriptional regulator with XRE-family HTH domain
MAKDKRHSMDIERTLDEMKQLREGAGMTQQALGEVIGVDRTYISKWENKVCRPEFNHLVMLWRTLHGLQIEVLG